MLSGLEWRWGEASEVLQCSLIIGAVLLADPLLDSSFAYLLFEAIASAYTLSMRLILFGQSK